MGVHAGKLGGNSNQRQELGAEVQPLQYAWRGTAYLNGAAQAHKQTDGAHAGRKTVLSTPRLRAGAEVWVGFKQRTS